MVLFRKYASAIILTLLSVFVVALTIDEWNDRQNILQDIRIEACMELETEDYEWDEANEFNTVDQIPRGIENKKYNCIILCLADMFNNVSLLSDAHKLGLVRRYAPNNNCLKYNYI